MSTIKNLATAPKEEIAEFINSFDHIFCDVDGVLLTGGIPIEGVDACIEKLRKLGKSIACFTNNSIVTLEVLEALLKPFNVGKDEIVNPVRCIIKYLKDRNFTEGIYVIGSQNLKECLADAGFNLVELKAMGLITSYKQIQVFQKNVSDQIDRIGAVVVDVTLNFELSDANYAVALLSSGKEMLFISGAADLAMPLTKDLTLLGAKFYIDAIEIVSKRNSIRLTKPSVNVKEIVDKEFNIVDPKRVLFIGDMIDTDMAFAYNCSYQKLLVLTGSTKENDVTNWKRPEGYKPNYYLQSLNDLGELLSKHGIV